LAPGFIEQEDSMQLKYGYSLVAAACLLSVDVLLAAETAAEHTHHHHAAADTGATAVDAHANHRAMMESPGVAVSQHRYELPAVALRNEQNEAVDLRQLLESDRPVIVNFIYTSCTTICPVMTASLLQLQRDLANRQPRPLYVSISVDPDFDSPAVLKSYANRFGADWTFLTGGRELVLGVLKNFDAWRGNKTNHAAITLMRSGKSAQWTRVEGLASANELAAIWRRIEG
jgi:protein SCO1